MTLPPNLSLAAQDLYSDDDLHPIPRVGVIDVETELERGGAYYSVVIASALKGDDRSQKRLLKKLENYLSDFYSPSALASRGNPTPQTCRIRVAIHPDSDRVIFRLLDQCRNWVEDNNIQFVVDSNFDEPRSAVH